MGILNVDSVKQRPVFRNQISFSSKENMLISASLLSDISCEYIDKSFIERSKELQLSWCRIQIGYRYRWKRFIIVPRAKRCYQMNTATNCRSPCNSVMPVFSMKKRSNFNLFVNEGERHFSAEIHSGSVNFAVKRCERKQQKWIL